MRRYSQNCVRPKVYKDIKGEEKSEEELEVNNMATPLNEDGKLVKLYEPRGAQIKALYELKNTREEGADKGLVFATTGIGKPYLAAFDPISFEGILFVAHREEILKQAQQSFKKCKTG